MQAKALVKRVLPGRYLLYRVRRHQQRIRNQKGIPELARRWAETYGTRVLRGPFEGLDYPLDMLPDVDAPVAKLAGVYEHHLQGCLPSAGTVIDIGAADGYYAVGLARNGCSVTAFEVDPYARRQLKRLAAQNRTYVRVLKECDSAALCSLQAPGFLLADCEGAETAIFTPEAVRHLAGTQVLLETHGTHDEMMERFPGLATVEPQDVTFPELEGFPDVATDELRSGDQTWLYGTA